jgi:hypothetical protein
VLVEEDPLGPQAGGGQPNGGTSGCKMCGVDACGLCQYEGGDFAFSCRDDSRPAVDWDCLATGSLYADGDEFYECWRCFVD